MPSSFLLPRSTNSVSQPDTEADMNPILTNLSILAGNGSAPNLRKPGATGEMQPSEIQLKIRLNASRVAPIPQRHVHRDNPKLKAESQHTAPPPRDSREVSHPQRHERREQLLLGASRGTSSADTCSQTFRLLPGKQGMSAI